MAYIGTEKAAKPATMMLKLKGKSGQQKVVVEHVNVAPGGQAVVELVTVPGHGEGVRMPTDEKPHQSRAVLMKNGNPRGDWWNAPRCAARTRRGTACRCPAKSTEMSASWR
jgi:hypothetical protein